jgi:hypothetical protein
VVEVDTACRHQIAGMAKAIEEMLLQALVTHSAIETFNEAALPRSPELDECGLGRNCQDPPSDGLSYEF